MWSLAMQLKNTAEAVNKPNSVSDPGYPETGYDHSSLDDGYPTSHATYPETWTSSPQVFLYLVLHQVGFTKLSRSSGKLVRSYRTFSPLPRRFQVRIPEIFMAVYFLLHFPSRCRDSMLWSTLLCGVRTFLWINKVNPAIV